MTWKEYKRTRLTAQERAILANNIERVSTAVKDGKMPTSANQTEITLIQKLTEDEERFVIGSMLNALAALDEIDVER